MSHKQATYARDGGNEDSCGPLTIIKLSTSRHKDEKLQTLGMICSKSELRSVISQVWWLCPNRSELVKG